MEPMLCNCDDEQYAVLKQRQQYFDKANDTYKESTIIPTESTTAEQEKMEDPGHITQWWHMALKTTTTDHTSLCDKDRSHHKQDSPVCQTDTNMYRVALMRTVKLKHQP